MIVELVSGMNWSFLMEFLQSALYHPLLGGSGVGGAVMSAAIVATAWSGRKMGVSTVIALSDPVDVPQKARSTERLQDLSIVIDQMDLHR